MFMNYTKAEFLNFLLTVIECVTSTDSTLKSNKTF